MSKELFEQIALITIAMTWSTIIVWMFRHEIRAFSGRQSGESFLAYVARAFKKAKIDCDAENNRIQAGYGGRTMIVIVSIANLTPLYLFAIAIPQHAWILVLYLVAGLAVTAKLNVIPAGKLKGLGFCHRSMIRIFHSWAWPVHVWRVAILR